MLANREGSRRFYILFKLPFGHLATATFQRYMDLVLVGLKWSSLLVYLDDICVFANTLTEHLQRMEEMFLRLRKFRLKSTPPSAIS